MSDVIQVQRGYPGFRILLAAAALVLVLGGLREAQGILVPFLFGFFLAIVGSAPLRWLTRNRVPTPVAVVIVAAVLIAFVVGVVTLLGSSIEEFRAVSDRYQDRVVMLAADAREWLEENRLEALSEQLFGEKSPEAQEASMLTTLDKLSPAAILSGLRGAVGGIVGAISSVFLVSIITIFMLVEAAEFRLKLRHAVRGSLDVDRLEQVSNDVQRYLAIKTVTSGVTGIAIFLFTWTLGIDFPHLWGLTAFILNYIPFVGSIIASIPAIILALLDLGPAYAITTGLGYVVVNVGVSNFLEPILMGRRLGLTPLVVFLSLVFWGWVWGPSGMLLSVPLTMILKILLEYSDDLNWIAVLMGSAPKGEAPGGEIESSL